MANQDTHEWFDGLDAVVAEPLKFKAMLGIGENAYASLRMKNKMDEILGLLSAMWSGAGIAKSSIVATTFFVHDGILAMLGIGTASTPIGWVVAAAILSGGAWYGITRYLKAYSKDRTITVPAFISTPLDLLALELFDLMAPLAMKVAAIDGDIHQSERKSIRSYFIEKWGYDQNFVDRGIVFVESRLSEFSVREIATTLARYQKENRDCDFDSMVKGIDMLLRNIMEADGRIDEREEMAIDQISHIFKETGKFSVRDLFPGKRSDKPKHGKPPRTGTEQQ